MLEIKFYEIGSQLLVNPHTIAPHIGVDNRRIDNLIEGQLKHLTELGGVAKYRGGYLLSYEQSELLIHQIVDDKLELLRLRLKLAIAHQKAQAKRGLRITIVLTLFFFLGYNLLRVAPRVYDTITNPNNELKEELEGIRSSQI